MGGVFLSLGSIVVISCAQTRRSCAAERCPNGNRHMNFTGLNYEFDGKL